LLGKKIGSINSVFENVKFLKTPLQRPKPKIAQFENSYHKLTTCRVHAKKENKINKLIKMPRKKDKLVNMDKETYPHNLLLQFRACCDKMKKAQTAIFK
jgi:hypothetical protein